MAIGAQRSLAWPTGSALPALSHFSVQCCPPQSSILFIGICVDLTQDRVVLKKMNEAGRQLAEREFAIEKIVDEHLRIFRELGLGSGE